MEFIGENADPTREKAGVEGNWAIPRGNDDPVEAALAAQLTRTDLPVETVLALTLELKARREARAGVLSLEAERARRGK